MLRLVIFGKGGIGKSTLACGLSASYARMGKRVLHVGCDPKHDSTAPLLGGRMIEPVVERFSQIRGAQADALVERSPLGIDCVEAGGPAAGVGCGGRGVSRMLELFDEAKLVSEDRYDVVLYDVLGDVVCGGFAAPLRRAVGEAVIIVISEELMALYAANNIARAVCHYAANGIALAGLIANLKDANADREILERFAARLGTKILGWIERDPLVREAEYRGMTVVESSPTAPISRRYGELARTLSSLDLSTLEAPIPLDDAEFYRCARRLFIEPSQGSRAPESAGSAGASGAKSPRDGFEDGARPSAVPNARDLEREARDSSFLVEKRNAALAIRLGLVGREEAVRRLRAAFPERVAGALAEPGDARAGRGPGARRS